MPHILRRLECTAEEGSGDSEVELEVESGGCLNLAPRGGAKGWHPPGGGEG